MAKKQHVREKTAAELPDFTIEKLGPSHYESPLKELFDSRYVSQGFVDDTARIVYNPDLKDIKSCFDDGEEPPSIEVAGPRRKIFFQPPDVRAAIVTCGGICPGLNDVIRAIVMEFH